MLKQGQSQKMRTLAPVQLHRDVYEDTDTPLMKLRYGA